MNELRASLKQDDNGEALCNLYIRAKKVQELKERFLYNTVGRAVAAVFKSRR